MTRAGNELSSADVAEWKHSVRSFFQDEWSQLRQLVLAMEEQTWGPVEDSLGVRTAASTTESSSADDEDQPAPTSTDERLAQLAQSIEMRMQNNNCGEF